MKKDLSISNRIQYNNKQTCKPLDKLSFGKYKIIMSKDEFSDLEKLYKQYVNVFGVEIGFVNYLLKQVPKWNS